MSMLGYLNSPTRLGLEGTTSTISLKKLLNALDEVSSAISRMRARGILDPSIDNKIKELILK